MDEPRPPADAPHSTAPTARYGRELRACVLIGGGAGLLIGVVGWSITHGAWWAMAFPAGILLGWDVGSARDPRAEDDD